MSSNAKQIGAYLIVAILIIIAIAILLHVFSGSPHVVPAISMMDG
jgi:signal peptidase I